MNAEIERQTRLREVREKLAVQAWDPLRHTPGDFAEWIKVEITKWGKIVRESGAKVN